MTPCARGCCLGCAGLLLCARALPWLVKSLWYTKACDCREPPKPLAHPGEVDAGLQHAHVLYASDERYFAGLLSSLISLSRHLKDPSSCTVHLIVPPAAREQAAEVVQCLHSELEDLPVLPEVRVHEHRPTGINVSALEGSYGRVHFGGMSYMNNDLSFARLFAHEYLPKSARRVLWLDVDVLVREDVLPLYQIELHGSIAAAPELNYWPERIHYVSGVWLQPEHFNNGVLLVDLERWKPGVQRMLDLLSGDAPEALKSAMTFQVAMNVAFQGEVDLIDWRWNVVGAGTPLVPKSCTDEGKILHFNGAVTKYWEPDKWWIFALNDGLAEPYLPQKQCGHMRQRLRA